MKLTIEQPTLAAALAKASGIVESRNTMPILANVLLDAEGDKLTIKATDLDIEVTTRIECEVITPGKVTVSAKLLADGVKGFAKGSTVTIDATGDRAQVTSGRRKLSLGILPAEDFPNLGGGEFTSEFSLPAAELTRLLGKSAFAISNDETRYHLAGIYLHSTPEGVTAVSTDGHRLAKVWSEEKRDFEGVTIPRKTVTEARKVFSLGDVLVSVSPNKIKLDVGDTVIVSKVIDAAFPDYDRIIPKGHPNNFTVDAKEFSSACTAVSIVCEDKMSRGVVMKVEGDTVELTVDGSVNDAEDAVDAYVVGDPVTMRFSSKYLADAMAQAEGGDMTIHYKGQMEPVLMRPTEDENMLIVVMPQRL